MFRSYVVSGLFLLLITFFSLGSPLSALALNDTDASTNEFIVGTPTIM